MCVLAGIASIASLAGGDVVTEPIDQDGVLVYPSDAEIPRSLTPTERRFIDVNPLHAGRGTTAPPTAPIICPGEYEPCDGIMLAWQGSSSWKNILAQMSSHITTTGDATVYMYVETAGDESASASSLSSAGANMSRVEFIRAPLDTIWIRDYGPRYIYEGDVRTIVDHTYNRPRPNDNLVPTDFSAYKGHAYTKLPLVHGGGNFHLETTGNGFSTELIQNENPGMSTSEIIGWWRDYQGLETTITDALPASVDATQHIDMWAIFISDTEAIVSEWPLQPGSTQATVCNTWAANLQAAGYTVYRIPAVLTGGTHYTFTNSVICNDLVIVPSYTNGTASQYNAQAKSIWETACPGKTVVQVNAQSIVTAAGVLHCICMHVPEPIGGTNPTAHIRRPIDGEVVDPNGRFDITWISDDDVSVSNVDILLSTDGGMTYPTVVASATADDGTFSWTVPNIFTTQARIKVIARDGDGNTGETETLDFSIDGGLQVMTGTIPALLEPGVTNSFDVTVDAGSETIVPGSPTLHYRYDGGAFLTTPLVSLGGDQFRADLPPALCDAMPEFYVSAAGSMTGTKTAPAGAPATTYDAAVGTLEMVDVLNESFEGGLPAGWSTSGLWGVTSSCGVGGTCDGSSSWAYYGLTGQCSYNSGTNSGVLQTTVTLPNPSAGGSITLRYCSSLQTEEFAGYDVAQFRVDGGVIVDAPSESSTWEERVVDLTILAGQTVTLEWSFDTVDDVNNNFRGWLVDNVRIEALDTVCDFMPPMCTGDANGDQAVDFDDLNMVLINWGTAGPAGDVDNSGAVNFDDLNLVLTNWGTTCTP